MVSVIERWEGGDRALKRAAGEYVETWAVGREQPRPNDLLKFAEDGYSQNSLIYSCIREKATSFASLRPHVFRGAVPVPNHRLVTLLENPNPTQDGAAFSEELRTHLDAAGNVYIHKVRQSENRARRREFSTFPIQELSLVRPDYVTIEPGATRAQDIFRVTIAGQVRARIPRSEMIHIRDVNLINDFYGLSRIAVLVREGAIDLEMSDFELAFFRNAGVPLGILNLKGRVKQQQAELAKNKIDGAVRGFKKWWTTLVLNADEATYTPMASTPKDMEQESTRFHVESRICAVFGVPGILVGARYALNATASFDYEQNQFQFWSETMVPESRRVAAAYTKQLLPEFATTRDTNARVDYDYSEVRALQEDRSRKLREAVRLIITGGVTVSRAFESVGLPVPPDSEFYVRNGNQVIVRADGTMEPMSQAPASEPGENNPLEGAAALDDEPVIVKSPRCAGCNKLLAKSLARGSEIACPRCAEVLVV